jgi:hypothetical protein
MAVYPVLGFIPAIALTAPTLLLTFSPLLQADHR